MKTVSIRVDKKQDREIDEYAERLNTDKSTALRNIIKEGLKVLKRNEALEKVRTRKWTIWKASEHCEISFHSFLQLLKMENIPFPLTVEDMEIELNENSIK